MAEAAHWTAGHRITMNGIPFDLSDDKEFDLWLEGLLKSSLQEHPEALKYASRRTKAWRRAYVLVSDLERRGLLRGG
jgi:hypothetical protein